MRGRVGHAHPVDEEQGIYRGEVIEIMGALGDIRVAVETILWYIRNDDEEDDEDDGDA